MFKTKKQKKNEIMFGCIPHPTIQCHVIFLNNLF